MRHPGSVVVVALLGEPHLPIERQGFVLIRNYRLSVGRWLLEFPAGTLDRPGEEESLTARRELEEEAGKRAGNLRRLGTILTSPGLTDEAMGVWVGWDLRDVGQRLEPGEQIRVLVRTGRELLGDIDAGELVDAKSLAALTLLERALSRGEFKPGHP